MYLTAAFLIQDIYYRKAKEECYRARSAYKLLQIDDIFHIFHQAGRVIDLCGSPGSWSQVCRKKLAANGYFNGDVVSPELRKYKKESYQSTYKRMRLLKMYFT